VTATQPDFVTLACPPGAENALVSFGDKGWEPYRERAGDRRSRWLVDVSRAVAHHFIGVGGFALADP